MARELFGSGSGERLHRLQLLRGQAADESLPMPRRRDWLSGEDKPVRRELHLLGPGLGKASAGALLDHGPGRSTSRSPKPPYRPRLAANSVMMSVGSVEGGLDHLFYSLRPRGPRPSALGPRPSWALWKTSKVQVSQARSSGSGWKMPSPGTPLAGCRDALTRRAPTLQSAKRSGATSRSDRSAGHVEHDSLAQLLKGACPRS
jgi:hypothetical protein